jgi:hypothetical protein
MQGCIGGIHADGRYDCGYPDEAIARRSLRRAERADNGSVLITAATRRSVMEYRDFL